MRVRERYTNRKMFAGVESRLKERLERDLEIDFDFETNKKRTEGEKIYRVN